LKRDQENAVSFCSLITAITMSASNNSTTHPTSSAPAGAMALYEKYSALHSGIEEARQQISQCQQDQDTLRDKIQRAREERVEMQQETERAKKETQDLHSQVQEALQENDATEQERLTLMECTNARRNYQVTKQYIQDQHQSYLESSRDFRQRCKRLRVTASAVGAPMATSHAFLALHAEDLSAEELEYLACPMEQQDEEQLDEELEQALEEHERSKKTRDDARADLQRVRKLDQESRGRAMNRRHKKEQLEAQLERLRNDVTDLRLELSTIENETQEAKEYAQNFERGMSCWASFKVKVSSSAHFLCCSACLLVEERCGTAPPCQSEGQLNHISPLL
jgi:chromosome segregation ATPase